MFKAIIVVSSIFSTFQFAAAQPFTIGYLVDDRYTMQNTYLINLFSRIADSGLVARNTTVPKTLQIKSKTFNNSADLQNCLNT